MKSEDVAAGYQVEEIADFSHKRNHRHTKSAVYYCTICTSFETPSWSYMKEHLKIKHNELAIQVSYRVRWEVV